MVGEYGPSSWVYPSPDKYYVQQPGHLSRHLPQYMLLATTTDWTTPDHRPLMEITLFPL